jgi:hypothetical protein
MAGESNYERAVADLRRREQELPDLAEAETIDCYKRAVAALDETVAIQKQIIDMQEKHIESLKSELQKCNEAIASVNATFDRVRFEVETIRRVHGAGAQASV